MNALTLVFFAATMATISPTVTAAQVVSTSPYAGVTEAMSESLSEGVGEGTRGAAIIAALGTGAAVNGTFLAVDLVHAGNEEWLPRGWAWSQLGVAALDLVAGAYLLYDGDDTQTALGTSLFGLGTILGTVSAMSLMLDEPTPASVGIGFYEGGGASLSVAGAF